MKKIITLVVFSLAILSTARTQPSVPVKAQLSQNSVVKDSSGTVYTYSVWSKLIYSGYYIIKAVNVADTNSEFILTRLSDEQRQQRLDKLPKPQESMYFKTGEVISGFKTTDMNGKKISLDDLRGKVVVINFWFINCPPCRQEIPELNQVVKDYKDSTNIVFIAVALDEKNQLKNFLRNTPFDYTIIDNGRFIADKYGVKGFPTHLVLDKDGKVYFHTSGFGIATGLWLRKSIQALL